MKPLLLLDIDGVLCPFGGDNTDHLRPVIGHEYARIDPKHTEWLRELSDLYDLAWASLWESGGNEVIAPAHDLNDIPFIPFTDSFEKHFDLTAHTPKLTAIESFVEDRPFAWVDDEIGDDAVRWAYERNKTIPTRFVQTDCRIGMDEATMHDLRMFGYTFANEIPRFER